MVYSAPTRNARVAGVATLLLGLLHAVTLPEITRTAPYLGLASGAVVLACLVGAQRLWAGGRIEGRIIAVAVAVVGLATQALNQTVGLPGAAVLQDRMLTETVVGVVLEVLILALLARDCREAAEPVSRGLYPVKHGNHGPDRRGR